MRENARQPGNYDHIMSLLRNPKISLRQIERYVTRREQLTRIVNHARHPTATMRKLIKRIATVSVAGGTRCRDHRLQALLSEQQI